jgi:predicted RNase H-like nuclease (RuvC/YqgF family)
MEIEWGTVIGVAITAGVSLALGILAYTNIPKKDMGASALAIVRAADNALDIQGESYALKVDDLEGRVERLEAAMLEKDAKIDELEERLESERKRFRTEIRQMQRWVEVLAEQVASLGGKPITISEIEQRS